MTSTYSDIDASRVVQILSSHYSIRDSRLNNYEGQIEFLIAEDEIKNSFPRLLQDLEKENFIATARRENYTSRLMPTLTSKRLLVDKGIVITVSRKQTLQAAKKRKFPIHLTLFMATVVVVFVDGIFKSRAFSGFLANDPLFLSGVYTVSLLGILGVHEMGHMIAARAYGLKASWPYFIPSIPVFFLSPTFGAMIQLRSNMPNRNAMFDVGIAGPLAGLAVAIVVSIYGASISVAVPPSSNLSGGYSIQPSLIMSATIDLAGKAASNGILVWSPVLMAAWIGFLVTFLNLLPAWQLDGGHIARSAVGTKWHQILTYSSIGVLLLTGWYVMAILVVLLSFRVPGRPPLDDVTPLSRKRKVIFVAALGLAAVCASPFPSFFA